MSHEACTARRYETNSPQAAARIVALALIANGEIKAKEWAVIEGLQVPERLGLSGEDWLDVLEALCADVPRWTGAEGCLVDLATLTQCLAEVDDPALQREVMRLCVAVIEADRHVDLGESIVMREMLAHWVLPEEEQASVEPLVYGLDFQVKPRHAAAMAA